VLANRLVPFSSRGPMIDGRIKPDITAPGLTLGTAISSYDTDYTPTGASSDLTISRYIDPLTTDTFYYAEFSGTSASSPAAAGIVALLLQADPTLTPQEIKDVLFYTAILDNYTGSLPPEGNNNWGHGKINAYGALKYLAQSVGLANYSDDNSCYLYPNPNDGVFNLHYLSKQSEEVKLEVADLTGKIVWARSWAVTEGVNQYPFDLSAFSGGLYFIRLTSGTKTTGVRTLIR
jgi:subtilisin family serine protease